MSDSDKSSIYTADESKVLKELSDIRLSVVRSMTADGPPQDVGRIRVLNEVITSADKAITDTANIRVKHDSSASSAETIKMVGDLILATRKRLDNVPDRGAIPVISKDASKITTVSGETDINPDKLDPDEFVPPVFDANGGQNDN